MKDVEGFSFAMAEDRCHLAVLTAGATGCCEVVKAEHSLRKSNVVAAMKVVVVVRLDFMSPELLNYCWNGMGFVVVNGTMSSHACSRSRSTKKGKQFDLIRQMR